MCFTLTRGDDDSEKDAKGVKYENNSSLEKKVSKNSFNVFDSKN